MVIILVALTFFGVILAGAITRHPFKKREIASVKSVERLDGHFPSTNDV